MKICEWCGGESTHGNKYCSVDCYRCAQRSGKYKTGTTMYYIGHCTYCGEDVYRASVPEPNAPVFCNRTCYDIHRANIVASRTVICVECGKEFIRHANKNRKYCSNECRINHKRAKARACKQCGKIFVPIYVNPQGDIKHPNNRKMCSEACMIEFYRTNEDRKDKISKAFAGDKHPNWQGGRAESRGNNWAFQRRMARKRDVVCQRCGMTKEESTKQSGRQLDVHHLTPIRYYIDPEDGNHLDNLILLCSSCHKTVEWEFFKGYAEYGSED